jgi:predicted AAA+ superfamily ATPase
MSRIARYLQSAIENDALAEKKIAFVAGPRQVGKTVLAEAILEKAGQKENYLTWDDDAIIRSAISSGSRSKTST